MAGPHDVHMRAEEEAGIKLRDRQREHQAIELHRLITAFKSFIIFPWNYIDLSYSRHCAAALCPTWRI